VQGIHGIQAIHRVHAIYRVQGIYRVQAIHGIQRGRWDRVMLGRHAGHADHAEDPPDPRAGRADEDRAAGGHRAGHGGQRPRPPDIDELQAGQVEHQLARRHLQRRSRLRGERRSRGYVKLAADQQDACRAGALHPELQRKAFHTATITRRHPPCLHIR
jgi:hypothetical protein